MAQAITMDADGQLPGRARTRAANNIRTPATVEGAAVLDVATAAAQDAVDKIPRPTQFTPVAGDPFYFEITN